MDESAEAPDGANSDSSDQVHFNIESRAEDGGPSVFEGFEHIIHVTDDSQVQQVLKAWKSFNPASHAAHEVLLHLKPMFQPSAFVTKVNGIDSNWQVLDTWIDKSARLMNKSARSPQQAVEFKNASGHGTQHNMATMELSGLAHRQDVIRQHDSLKRERRSLPMSLQGTAARTAKQHKAGAVDAKQRRLPPSLQHVVSSSSTAQQAVGSATKLILEAMTPRSVATGQRAQQKSDIANMSRSFNESATVALPCANSTPAKKLETFSQAPKAGADRRTAKHTKSNAFSILMASTTRSVSSPVNPQGAKEAPSKFDWGKAGSWSDVFTKAIADPEKYQQSNPSLYVVHCDNLLIIHDQYPKARVHLLFIARNPQLLDISCLGRQHVPLLELMRARAHEWIRSHQLDHEDFQMGFHWKPSMKQLHMHCISTDFNGDALRQSKHWRSFTSIFFRKVDAVIQELDRDGAIRIDFKAIDALMRAPLACNRCGVVLASLPAAKQHNQTCSKSAEKGGTS